MGKINKDGYFYKQLATEKRMEENKKITTLTEEQHNALAELCRIRHNLHINHALLFNAEADNTQLYNDYDSINDILTGVGLDMIEGLPQPEDIITTVDYDIDNEGLDLEEWSNKYYPLAVEQWDDINNKIEDYLRKIDEKHHTNYCPTGATRIY